MNQRPIRELDVIALTADLPAEGLFRGQVGTVVHLYSPDAFEVEFVGRDGQTYGLTTLTSEQVLLLHYDPVVAA